MGRRKRALTEHEEATIATFVLPARQERERLLLARGDYDSSQWSHNPPLIEATARPIPVDWRADDLLEELRRRGAPETATGIHGQLHGQTVPLEQAVERVFAARYGDLISVLPGRLAYYDGEERHVQYLLVRT